MAQMPNDVINEIYHDGYMAGYDEGFQAAISRWIPVTERLPENGVYVLAYSADDGYMCVEAKHKFAVFQITHWMPLPEPPKEE